MSNDQVPDYFLFSQDTAWALKVNPDPDHPELIKDTDPVLSQIMGRRVASKDGALFSGEELPESCELVFIEEDLSECALTMGSTSLTVPIIAIISARFDFETAKQAAWSGQGGTLSRETKKAGNEIWGILELDLMGREELGLN